MQLLTAINPQTQKVQPTIVSIAIRSCEDIMLVSLSTVSSGWVQDLRVVADLEGCPFPLRCCVVLGVDWKAKDPRRSDGVCVATVPYPHQPHHRARVVNCRSVNFYGCW